MEIEANIEIDDDAIESMIEKKIENHIDYDDIVDYVQRNIDTDRIIDKVCESLDYDDIADSVRESLDMSDIADTVSGYIDIDGRAESLLDSYAPGNGCGLGNAFTNAIKDGILYLISNNTEFTDALKTYLFIPNFDEIVDRKMSENFEFHRYMANKDRYLAFIADETKYNQYLLDREEYQKYLLEKKASETTQPSYNPFGGTSQINIA